MRRGFLLIWAAASCAAGSEARAAIQITHAPIGCVVAGQYPVVDAHLEPAEAVARARVYFKGADQPTWYFVEMTPQGDGFRGVLPKPGEALRRIDYYLDVQDKSAGESRTADFAPAVVSKAASCGQGVTVAAMTGTASVAVGAAPGAPAVPAGFSSAGLTSVAAGGGHAALYVVGGVVTAAGTALVASELVGGGSNVTMEGNVYVGVPPPAGAAGPVTPGSPIAGAVVSTTLDSTTATTDAAGAFNLETSSPSHKGQGTVFTLTVRAAGCQTFQQTGDWGDHSKGQVFTLRCP